MNEREKKAFDFAADLTKQLITLSTGIVTVTLLLSKDFVGPRTVAVAAWTFYLISTICGLWALMALTGTLAPLKKGKTGQVSDINSKSSASTNEHERFEIGNNVRRPSLLQVLAFGLATILTLVYVFATFAHQPQPVPPPTKNCCCQCQPFTPTH